VGSEARLPFAVMAAGQLIAGAVVSATVTVPVHELAAPRLRRIEGCPRRSAGTGEDRAGTAQARVMACT
jgi:hypothetical protein